MPRRIRPLPSAILAALIIVGGAACVNAQTANPEDAVRAVIDNLFDAMRAGDGNTVSKLFHDSARMNSIGVREGQAFIRTTSPSDFAAAVNEPSDEAWDERIWDVEIRVDGHMASAWVPYAFYLGDSFSHCGTNTLTFFNGPDGWQITGITDTRRQNDCGIPPEVAGQ
ncbi:MAG: DUF4440 domain-containing protein [Rhodothermales bacterium]|nr:DUF4440 domain-containing protein [Rhodothermales bacterium]